MQSDGPAPSQAPADEQPLTAGDEALVSHAPRDDESPNGSNSAAWSNLWQAPVILLSVTMIALGILRGYKPPVAPDFAGALAQVEQWIVAGEHELAARQLRDVIEPNLAGATEMQRAEFHAAVADYVASSLQNPEIDKAAALKRVHENYTIAVESGFTLSTRRLTQWAECLLAADLPDEARKRLSELDAISTSDDYSGTEKLEAQSARHRIFRGLVEHLLAKSQVTFEDLMTMLAEYRLSPNLTPEDEIWAIARQTELRLLNPSSDSPRLAIDLLLVEMRRLENRQIPTNAALGELYVLLGRCYMELGDYDRAKMHLDRSLTMFEGPEPAHGDAMVMLGQIAAGQSNIDQARDYFHTVVRDFVTTRSFLPALLGLAESESILGMHSESLAEYALLCEHIQKPSQRPTISAAEVAESLCDRFDAAIAMGNVDRALEYVAVADRIFKPEEMPAEILIRQASGHRQLADSILISAAGEGNSEFDRLTLDPAVRRQVNSYYERAGEYYLRHASATKSSAQAAEEASLSNWLAADSFDLAGRQDLAIAHFGRYIDMHPVDDSRRAATLFRLAQAQQATGDYDAARQAYERVIREYPRSAEAPQSYVPLARCFVAVKREADARQVLHQVLSGSGLMTPEATDYREALFELASLEYTGRVHTAAIEAFTEFLQRYADDRRATEVRFLLGDSHRAHGLSLLQTLRDDPNMASSEANQWKSLAYEQLQLAQSLFAQVRSAQDTQTNLKVSGETVRRALVYEADCAFERGEYEHAISTYDLAARQYSSHQCSMYALVQIVNAYTSLGDQERSTAAHQRALVRLKQLPDEAFRSPDSLMNREAWERWLENHPVGMQTAGVSNSN